MGEFALLFEKKNVNYFLLRMCVLSCSFLPQDRQSSPETVVDKEAMVVEKNE